MIATWTGPKDLVQVDLRHRATGPRLAHVRALGMEWCAAEGVCIGMRGNLSSVATLMPLSTPAVSAAGLPPSTLTSYAPPTGAK
jgi:hypothetical protein